MNDEKKSPATLCLNCGGQLNIDGLQDIIECQYCGTKFAASDIFNESDAIRIEKIKSQTYKDVEAEKQKIESERMKQEAEKNKDQVTKDSVTAFKKGTLSKILIIFIILALLFCATAFHDGRVLAGLISVVMIALAIVAYLMGMQVINEKKKGIHILVAIVAFILIVPYFSTYSAVPSVGKIKMGNIQWPDSEIAQLLPVPKSNVGEISSESAESLIIYIGNTSKEDYDAYIDECKKRGFTVDYSRSDDFYYADNEAGYDLSLMYQDNSTMYVSIIEPQKAVVSDNKESTKPTKQSTVTPTKQQTKQPTDQPADKPQYYNDTSSTVGKDAQDTIYARRRAAYDVAEKQPDVVLMANNNTKLAALLQLKDPGDSSTKEFSLNYYNWTIEFDGNIAYVSNYENSKQYFTVLVSAGNYSKTKTYGPNFQFENIGSILYPDAVVQGQNVHIKAKVGAYNEVQQLFTLTPISIKIR